MAELSFLVLICKTLGGIYTCAKFCQFTDNLDEHDVNVSMFFFYIGTVYHDFLQYKHIWTIKWEWWRVKLYKAINIFQDTQTRPSQTWVKTKQMYPHDQNTQISLANGTIAPIRLKITIKTGN